LVQVSPRCRIMAGEMQQPFSEHATLQAFHGQADEVLA
jgi:hypothetical protein